MALALAATLVSVVAVGPAAAADFPPSDSRYHTYNEMVAEVTAVAAAHPDIVSLFSIGKTYKGRDIWVAKVSDEVATDDPLLRDMFLNFATNDAQDIVELLRALATSSGFSQR